MSSDSESWGSDFSVSISNVKRRPKERKSKISLKAQISALAYEEVQTEKDLSDVDQPALSRVRKALALAKHSGTSEAEARNALRLAHKLMAQLNISQADVIEHETAEQRSQRAGLSSVAISYVNAKSTPPRLEWAVLLAHAIKTFFNCKYYTEANHGKKTSTYCFYGLAESTVAAAYAFEMVFNQTLAWAQEKLYKKLIKGTVASNSYKAGVARGLLHMAEESRAADMKAAEEVEAKSLQKQIAAEKAQRALELARLEGPAASSSRIKVEDSDPEIVQNEKDDESEEEIIILSGGNPRSDDIKPKLEVYNDDDDDDFFNDEADYQADDVPDIDLDQALDEAESKARVQNDIKEESDQDLKPKIEIKSEESSESVTKEEESEQQPTWTTVGQLTLFRQNADRIADDFLAAKKDFKLRAPRKRKANQHDWKAYQEGRKDSAKIDVKRRRIDQ